MWLRVSAEIEATLDVVVRKKKDVHHNAIKFNRIIKKMTNFGELVNQCLLSFSYILDKKLPKWAAAIKGGCNKRKGGE